MQAHFMAVLPWRYLQTNDNTQGALDEARKYLQKPYELVKPANGN